MKNEKQLLRDKKRKDEVENFKKYHNTISVYVFTKDISKTIEELKARKLYSEFPGRLTTTFFLTKCADQLIHHVWFVHYINAMTKIWKSKNASNSVISFKKC